MQFPGFAPEDFDVFTVPDFSGRMAAIRARLKPKLLALGEDLAPELTRLAGGSVHPHVAQHLRRRINPPEETWVAFGRDRKGYKRWTHFRVAVSGSGLRVTVFVEDDSDDKVAFGKRLGSSAAEVLPALAGEPPVIWYTFGSAPTATPQVTAAGLREYANRVEKVKLHKFQAGVPLPKQQVLALAPADLEAWIQEQAGRLAPLYRLGAGIDG